MKVQSDRWIQVYERPKQIDSIGISADIRRFSQRKWYRRESHDKRNYEQLCQSLYKDHSRPTTTSYADTRPANAFANVLPELLSDWIGIQKALLNRTHRYSTPISIVLQALYRPVGKVGN
ncbi:hypothetical protein DMJ13_21160 [halophilic archaeon]|nr:hypothetical protein DMJ13_21160 [halophilic archaeon]